MALQVLAGLLVKAVGDGDVVITAKTADGKEATAKVSVRGSKATSAPSFRNHVVPILTRMGCNSGACHGALAGKGGLKLSLRGYAPEVDHFVLTRQAGGRRQPDAAAAAGYEGGVAGYAQVAVGVGAHDAALRNRRRRRERRG